MSFPDLTRAVAYRSQQLNTVTESIVDGVPVLVGCQIDVFDLGTVEIRQFREPQAFRDGIDVGGSWLGGRQFSITATVYDKTRGETYARLQAIAAILLPVSGDFGYYALTYSSIGGTTPTVTGKSITCMPMGISAPIEKIKHSSRSDNQPLAIQWKCTFYCKDPAIT